MEEVVKWKDKDQGMYNGNMDIIIMQNNDKGTHKRNLATILWIADCSYILLCT